MSIGTVVLLSVLGFLNPSMGTRNPADIPVPKKNFDVIVIDSDDNKLELSFFSCEGEVYLKGMLGKAQGIVSFEKISSISFFTENHTLSGRLMLKNGKEIILEIKRNLLFYGKTDFGNFILRAEDIKSITFK